MDADNQKQIDLCKNELRLYGICEINLLDLPLEYWTELVELVKFVKSHPLFKEIKIFAIKFLDDLIHTDIIAQVKKPDQNNIDDINEIKYPTIYLNPDMRQNVRFEKRLKNRTISKNNSFKSVVFHEMMHLFIIQLTMK